MSSHFDCNLFLRIATDSIKTLRKGDVYRVLNAAPAAHTRKLVNFIVKHRPELSKEVDDCMKEIRDDSRAAKKSAKKSAAR